jgi:hypothetical protein
VDVDSPREEIGSLRVGIDSQRVEVGSLRIGGGDKRRDCSVLDRTIEVRDGINGALLY